MLSWNSQKSSTDELIYLPSSRGHLGRHQWRVNFPFVQWGWVRIAEPTQLQVTSQAACKPLPVAGLDLVGRECMAQSCPLPKSVLYECSYQWVGGPRQEITPAVWGKPQTLAHQHTTRPPGKNLKGICNEDLEDTSGNKGLKVKSPSWDEKDLKSHLS